METKLQDEREVIESFFGLISDAGLASALHEVIERTSCKRFSNTGEVEQDILEWEGMNAEGKGGPVFVEMKVTVGIPAEQDRPPLGDRGVMNLTIPLPADGTRKEAAAYLHAPYMAEQIEKLGTYLMKVGRNQVASVDCPQDRGEMAELLLRDFITPLLDLFEGA